MPREELFHEPDPRASGNIGKAHDAGMRGTAEIDERTEIRIDGDENAPLAGRYP